MLKKLALIIIGLVAGVISSGIGGSQADTMLPALILLNIISDYKTALGTTLLAIMPPTNILAVYRYWKKGQVDIYSALILTVTATIGSYFGVSVSNVLSSKIQKRLMATFLFIISMYLVYSSYK